MLKSSGKDITLTEVKKYLSYKLKWFSKDK
jgi:hypothetical protein